MLAELIAQNPFGNISPPPGVAGYGTGATGIISIINIILRLLIIAGGIYALVNIILAGYGFMSAGGDPKAIEKSWAKIWQSLIGLLLIAGAFVIIAVISQILFGDATIILDPKIVAPGSGRNPGLFLPGVE